MVKLAWAQSFAILIALSTVIAGCPPPKPAIVPDIFGLPLASAYTVLEDAGFFRASVSEDYNDTVAAGHVILQHPQAGTTVSPEISVEITVSLGPDPSNTFVTVPDLGGLTRETAESVLSDLALQLGIVTEAYDETFAMGQILGQSPEAGTVVTRGAAIDVTISLGSANPLTIDEAFSGFLDSEIPIDLAVQDLVNSTIHTFEQEGTDAVLAQLDAARENALEDDPANLERLWQRSYEAGSFEVILPEIEPEISKLSSGIEIEDRTACEAPIEVIWVNGMAVDKAGYIKGLWALRAAISEVNPPIKTRVAGHYQISATEAYNSRFADECLSNRANGSFTSLACWYAGAAIDLGESALQKSIAWLNYPRSLSPESILRDVNGIRDKIIAGVDDGRRVVIVAHSQGNFFAEAALASLGSDDFGPRKDSVGIISVGSPEVVEHTFTIRVSICEDPVSEIVPDPACRPWAVDFAPEYDIAAHYFESAYLAQNDTKSGITGTIFLWTLYGDSGSQLRNPRGTGSLRVETGEPGNTVLSPAKPSAEVRLYNDGPKDLEWISEQSPVLSVSPDPGTIRAGENVAITISYTPGAALTYPHNEVVKFINPCAEESISTKEVPVQIVMPVLGVSESSISLTANENSVVIDVTNTANEHPIRWTATPSDDRVTVSPPSGEANSTEVTISVDGVEESFDAEVLFTNAHNPADQRKVQIRVTPCRLRTLHIENPYFTPFILNEDGTVTVQDSTWAWRDTACVEEYGGTRPGNYCYVTPTGDPVSISSHWSLEGDSLTIYCEETRHVEYRIAQPHSTDPEWCPTHPCGDTLSRWLRIEGTVTIDEFNGRFYFRGTWLESDSILGEVQTWVDRNSQVPLVGECY